MRKGERGTREGVSKVEGETKGKNSEGKQEKDNNLYSDKKETGDWKRRE